MHPVAQGLTEGLGAGGVCISSLFPGDSTAAGVNQAWEGTARVSLSADLHGLGCGSAHSRCLITTQRMDGFPVVPPLPLSLTLILCKLQEPRGHQLACRVTARTGGHRPLPPYHSSSIICMRFPSLRVTWHQPRHTSRMRASRAAAASAPSPAHACSRQLLLCPPELSSPPAQLHRPAHNSVWVLFIILKRSFSRG